MANLRKKFVRQIQRLKPTTNDVKRLFPISIWLPQYNLHKLQGDILAGVTVGLMVVPQSLAFATFAGLPPHYGLYTAFPPSIIYFFLGSAKDMNVGPTVVSSLMTARYNESMSPHGAAALAFVTGIILFAMGLFRLGFTVKFIPTSVVSGFVSAAAITIMVNQLKGLFGHKTSPPSFHGKLIHFFRELPNTNPWDAAIGLTCLALLIILQEVGKKLAKSPPREGKNLSVRKCFYKIARLACVGRSALICILATVIAYGIYSRGHRGMTLPAKLPSGLPNVEFPLKQIFDAKTNQTVHTADMVGSMGAGLAVIPLILFIENISVAKALGRKNGYTVDATQELYAVGLANVFGSLFGGYPVTGSFTRSAVNSMSGAATTFSGLVTSAVVILSLSFLTPVFSYVPMAALSAMVMAAVIGMIEFSVPRRIWKINKIDIIAFLASFFGTFYELEVGVLGGSVVALFMMLYREVVPRRTVDFDPNGSVGAVKFFGGIWYPGTESIVGICNQMKETNSKLKLIRIDFENVYELDYTVVVGLKLAASELLLQGVEMTLVNVNSPHVRRVVVKAGLANMIESHDAGDMILCPSKNAADIEKSQDDEQTEDVDQTNDLQDEEERLNTVSELGPIK